MRRVDDRLSVGRPVSQAANLLRPRIAFAPGAWQVSNDGPDPIACRCYSFVFQASWWVED